MLKFKKSAFKHRATVKNIAQVLFNQWGMTKWFKIKDHEDGYSQEIAVGFDGESRLLEIGITYVGDDEVVFHAKKASSMWEDRYNKEQ